MFEFLKLFILKLVSDFVLRISNFISVKNIEL